MAADKQFSLKKYWQNRNKTIAKQADTQVPIWNIRLLQFLFVLVYFYGGIAKMNVDWLSGDIAEVFLRPTFGVTPPTWAVYFLTYGGLLFDLTIGFLLLMPKTRWYAIFIVIAFHLTNGLVLFTDIGLFPFLMIACTIIFIESVVVRRFMQRIFSKRETRPDKKKGRRAKKKSQTMATAMPMKDAMATVPLSWTPKRKVVASCILLFVAFQLLFPFRHLLLPGNPEWTGLGTRFAWRMKMETRKVESFKMTSIDRVTGEEWLIDHESFVSTNQLKHIVEDPFCIVQLAKYLNKLGTEKGMTNPIVKADIQVGFNGRATQSMLDPTVDLTQVDRYNFYDIDWITPLVLR